MSDAKPFISRVQLIEREDALNSLYWCLFFILEVFVQPLLGVVIKCCKVKSAVHSLQFATLSLQNGYSHTLAIKLLSAVKCSTFNKADKIKLL